MFDTIKKKKKKSKKETGTRIFFLMKVHVTPKEGWKMYMLKSVNNKTKYPNNSLNVNEPSQKF